MPLDELTYLDDGPGVEALQGCREIGHIACWVVRSQIHLRLHGPFEHGSDCLHAVVGTVRLVGLAVAQDADRGRGHPGKGKVREYRRGTRLRRLVIGGLQEGATATLRHRIEALELS